MNKKNTDKRFTFLDLAIQQKQERWNNHWLKKILDLINWNKFTYRLEQLYSNEDNGRPAWDPVVLFRCLLLAQWYGLSDRALEEALEYRIDFCKFSGVDMNEAPPDATTFVNFRERIQPIWDKLLNILNKQIESAGFEIKSVISVDATLIEAHSKPCGKTKEGDPDAAWRGFPTKQLEGADGTKTIARRPAKYCYKLNAAVSVGHGFISGLSVCKGSEHETHHFKKFITNETRVAYADKGYVGNREYLKKNGIKDGIQAKAVRGKHLTVMQIKRNKKITTQRRIVESVFGGWKLWYGWMKTKYLGLNKNELAAGLTAIAWNMKKFAVLQSAQGGSVAKIWL